MAAEETWIGGFHAVLALLEEGEHKPREILLSDTRRDARAQRVMHAAAKAHITVRTVSRSELDLKAPDLRHQGVLAAVKVEALATDDVLDQPGNPGDVVLVLDGVQDPHNLGACVRTAEAAGALAVVVPKDRAASLTPVARKAAAGSAERLPVVAVTNLVRELERLKELGYWIVGLAGEAEETLYDVDLTVPVVLVMGAEGEGMRRLTRETCDRLVSIPMFGDAESLNVSVASGVCLYEALRQRSSS